MAIPSSSFRIFLLCCFSLSAVLCQYSQMTLQNWQLQNSANVGSANGEKISQSSYNADSWFPITVPATAVAGLVQNGVYEDPFFGLHLLNISHSQFSTPWWYRATFDLPVPLNEVKTILEFKGINYRANIYCNGHQIAHSNDVVGTFRYFEFDIQSHLTQNNNVIAIEIYEPIDEWTTTTTTDLAISFVDWSPYAPDSSMGLWREVYLHLIEGSVKIDYPMVATVLTADNTMAHLTVVAEFTNYASEQISGTVQVTMEGIGSFQQQMVLSPGSSQLVFSNATFSVLNVANPQLWWPWQMGDAILHNMSISFIETSTNLYYTLNTTFGIRQMTSSLEQPHNFRVYSVNGQKILVKGAGWAPDLFLRASKQDLVDQLSLVRHMNLNAVRLEGKMNDDYFFQVADELGLLILPGWCCCDSWQHWSAWKTEEYDVAKESMRTQLKRLRIHASILVFLYSSDELPPVKVEQDYLDVANEVMWPNPLLAAAARANSTLTGPTGVKMSGPYSWVPPYYWYNLVPDLGGAFGFLTEGGPGENPMTYESLQRTIPADALWPINFEWDYHCGNQDGLFGSLQFFTPPLNERMGNATSAQDYATKAQAMTYESHRALFEAYSRNKYTATGVIQWMLNNAFPENIWHLYDYYLNPGGSYFGTKIANEPVHISYSYNDSSIWMVNSMYVPYSNLVATATVYLITGDVAYTNSMNVDTLPADSPIYLFTLPEIDNLSYTYFLLLTVAYSSEPQTLLSRNVYWLSTQMDVITPKDYTESTFYRTPVSTYANFTQLQTLPAAPIDLSTSADPGEYMTTFTCKLQNLNNAVAFQVRLRIVDSNTNLDILPVFWSDNYVTMFPMETIVLTAEIANHNLLNKGPEVVIETYNNIVG